MIKTPTVIDTAFFGNRVIYQPAYNELGRTGMIIETRGAGNNLYQIYNQVNP